MGAVLRRPTENGCRFARTNECLRKIQVLQITGFSNGCSFARTNEKRVQVCADNGKWVGFCAH